MLERPQQPARSSRTLQPGGLEQLDRRAADGGLGVGRERVGEEDDVAAASPPLPARAGANQRSSVSRVKRGSGRRRSMPATRSSSGARHRAVGQRRGRRAEPVQRADRAEQPASAAATPWMRLVVREELALQRRHVDAQRALALARLALQAEVEDLVQPLVAERGARVGLRERLDQRVGAPARGVLLLARGHVGRAHRRPSPLLRQAPMRWQRSAARAHPAVERRGACAAAGAGGQRRVAQVRRSAARASTITPGLRRPCGSNSRLTSRNAP